jgi:hypothetical protein
MWLRSGFSVGNNETIMSEHTQSESNFTGKAAEIASEYFSKRGRHEADSQSDNLHLQALASFVPRTEGQITPSEIHFIEYCINESIANREDPTRYVSAIADKLNDLQKRVIVNYLRDASKLASDTRSDLRPDAN